MTPGARVAAAIDILDRVLGGEPAEKALTGWARRARYAGSKDRAAVRDHVYDVLRRRRSCAARGGAATGGRGLMLGLLRQDGQAPIEALFSGAPYAPAPLSAAEQVDPGPSDAPDLPDWLVPLFQASLGEAFADTVEALRHRAPVLLRVNLRKSRREAAMEALAAEGIEVEPCSLADTALRVTKGARQVARSNAFAQGVVELQDGSSQAAVAAMELNDGARVLDLCAGGGGKILALAARHNLTAFAHDIDPRRMQDLPGRAARSGVEVCILNDRDISTMSPYDVILCDVPCSGSGTWRRTPDAKWRLTPERLDALLAEQDAILDQAAKLAGKSGRICYMTCSVLEAENEARIAAFLARAPGWTQARAQRWPVSGEGDGFFCAQLTR